MCQEAVFERVVDLAVVSDDEHRVGLPEPVGRERHRAERRAQRGGHVSVGEYLRAIPRSDEEKKEAVDLALKGLLLCIVGIVLPPLLLIGIFPLYYGARKVMYWQTGLGLFDGDSGA